MPTIASSKAKLAAKTGQMVSNFGSRPADASKQNQGITDWLGTAPTRSGNGAANYAAYAGDSGRISAARDAYKQKVGAAGYADKWERGVKEHYLG